MLKAITLAAVLFVGACTASQLATVNKVQNDVAAACTTAMSLAPFATLAGPAGASIAGYITAGCGTEAAVAKLATDPTSVAWVNGLVAQVKAL